jgi:hypothetical protein
MGWVGTLHLVALCCATVAAPASAEGQVAPASPPPRWLVFSGTEASIRSITGWAGADHAPAGLDADGVRVRGVVGSGRYRAGHPTVPSADIVVDKRIAMLSVGRTWAAPDWQARLFAGGEVDARAPSEPGASSADRGTRSGATLGVELWATPMPGLQLTADAGFGTARSAWAVRASLCHRIGALCLGVDGAATGDSAGSEVRFGVALAGLSFGAMEVRLVGGFARKDGGEGGSYGFISVWQRF